MLKALVIKELRESAGIVALTALAAVFAVVSLTGTSVLPIFSSSRIGGIPFVNDAFQFYLSVTVGGLALALGLKQSAWEFSHNTYYFLLHRPVRRAAVFWVKLAVGCALLNIIGATMILAYGAWAATPGKIGAPFFWSMTVPAWAALACLNLVYLTSFLCGIRPARWFGSRLAPAVFGLVVTMFFYQALWFWLIPIASIVAACVVLTAIFFYVRQRDY